MKEARAAKRIDIKLKVNSEISKDIELQIGLAKGNRFEGHSFNISATGVGICIEYYLPKGTLIDMELEGTPFGLSRPIETKGEVRYCNFAGNAMYKCGVKFLDISRSAKEAITGFVSKYEEK